MGRNEGFAGSPRLGLTIVAQLALQESQPLVAIEPGSILNSLILHGRSPLSSQVAADSCAGHSEGNSKVQGAILDLLSQR